MDKLRASRYKVITPSARRQSMNAPLEFASLRNQVSAQEWQTRVDLAAAYRLVALFGWDDLVFTHISARIPGEPDNFLINPYGLFFDAITASRTCAVQMLDVAFSRRMCCSRVCNASRYAGLPCASTVTPTSRPGMLRFSSSRTAM